MALSFDINCSVIPEDRSSIMSPASVGEMFLVAIHLLCEY